MQPHCCRMRGRCIGSKVPWWHEDHRILASWSVSPPTIKVCSLTGSLTRQIPRSATTWTHWQFNLFFCSSSISIKADFAWLWRYPTLTISTRLTCRQVGSKPIWFWAYKTAWNIYETWPTPQAKLFEPFSTLYKLTKVLEMLCLQMKILEMMMMMMMITTMMEVVQAVPVATRMDRNPCEGSDLKSEESHWVEFVDYFAVGVVCTKGAKIRKPTCQHLQLI